MLTINILVNYLQPLIFYYNSKISDAEHNYLFSITNLTESAYAITFILDIFIHRPTLKETSNTRFFIRLLGHHSAVATATDYNLSSPSISICPAQLYLASVSNLLCPGPSDFGIRKIIKIFQRIVRDRLR